MHFLFSEGEWEGSGHVTFSASPEVIPFTTKWVVTDLGGRQFRAIQKVCIPDLDGQTNTLTVTDCGLGKFQVFLENETLGVFSGNGVWDEGHVAWEFAHSGALEGIEVYEKMSDDEYSFRAEYTSGGEYSTFIRGTLSRTHPL